MAWKIARLHATGVKSETYPVAKKRSAVRRSTSFEPLTARAFGEVVRSLREAQHLAQDQFALKASVDRSYYGKLERGERQPSLGLLLRIAGALNVPGATLVEKTEVALKRLRGPISVK